MIRKAPIEARNRFVSSRWPRSERKIQRAWDVMLTLTKRKVPFTNAQISEGAGLSRRFSRTYIAALRDAGYLVEPNKSTDDNATRYYLVAFQYRGDVAPQLAGGSGGGGKLGKGWNSLKGKTP